MANNINFYKFYKNSQNVKNTTENDILVNIDSGGIYLGNNTESPKCIANYITNVSQLINDSEYVKLSEIINILNDALEWHNLDEPQSIGSISQNNEIIINDTALASGTYTLKYIDKNSNEISNFKYITKFTI